MTRTDSGRASGGNATAAAPASVPRRSLAACCYVGTIKERSHLMSQVTDRRPAVCQKHRYEPLKMDGVPRDALRASRRSAAVCSPPLLDKYCCQIIGVGASSRVRCDNHLFRANHREAAGLRQHWSQKTVSMPRLTERKALVGEFLSTTTLGIKSFTFLVPVLSLRGC